MSHQASGGQNEKIGTERIQVVRVNLMSFIRMGIRNAFGEGIDRYMMQSHPSKSVEIGHEVVECINHFFVFLSSVFNAFIGCNFPRGLTSALK